jgi:hypothetical protein
MVKDPVKAQLVLYLLQFFVGDRQVFIRGSDPRKLLIERQGVADGFKLAHEDLE